MATAGSSLNICFCSLLPVVSASRKDRHQQDQSPLQGLRSPLGPRGHPCSLPSHATTLDFGAFTRSFIKKSVNFLLIKINIIPHYRPINFPLQENTAWKLATSF